MRTCRDAVLEAFDRLERRTRERVFDLASIVAEVERVEDYKRSTIVTHVTSRMCASSPDHHATVYGDLVRVDRGRYQRA